MQFHRNLVASPVSFVSPSPPLNAEWYPSGLWQIFVHLIVFLSHVWNIASPKVNGAMWISQDNLLSLSANKLFQRLPFLDKIKALTLTLWKSPVCLKFFSFLGYNISLHIWNWTPGASPPIVLNEGQPTPKYGHKLASSLTCVALLYLWWSTLFMILCFMGYLVITSLHIYVGIWMVQGMRKRSIS